MDPIKESFRLVKTQMWLASDREKVGRTVGGRWTLAQVDRTGNVGTATRAGRR
nr:hypothetical protein Iba_chr06dCG9960 [Ipomoea batatas]